MEKGPKSNSKIELVIVGHEAAIKELEERWVKIYASYNEPDREKILNTIAGLKAELVTRVARFKEMILYDGAINLERAYKVTPDNEKTSGIQKIVDELEREIASLQAKASPSAASEVKRIEKELRLYQNILATLRPLENFSN